MPPPPAGLRDRAPTPPPAGPPDRAPTPPPAGPPDRAPTPPVGPPAGPPSPVGTAPAGPPPATQGQRLHPAAIALGPLRQLLPLAGLALLSLVTRGGGASGVLGLVALAAVGSSALRWAFFRWQVAEDALVIYEGVLRRQRRVIPLSRIQTVDLARPLAHRLLGVVQVHVETVGGGQAEGRLEALSLPEAARLRALLLRLSDPSPDAPATISPPMVALSPGMLVIAGLTGGRVGVAAALVGVIQQVAGDRVFDVVDDLTTLGVTTVLLLVVVVLVTIFVLSVIATAITFWGFELRREGQDLTVRRGLLEQRFDTVPLVRVQAVILSENLMRRAFGLATLQVVVAGRAGGDTAAQQAVIMPLGTRQQAWQLIEEVFGTPDLGNVALQAMPTAARGRRVRRALAVTLMTTAATSTAFGWTGLLGLTSVLLWTACALLAYRALGHARPPGHVIARQGIVVRRTTVVPVSKVQSAAMHQTIFQRRLGLATLGVHIATTTRAGTVPVVDLDADLARVRLVDLLDPAAAAVPQATAILAGDARPAAGPP